jgi:hypothetical protein
MYVSSSIPPGSEIVLPFLLVYPSVSIRRLQMMIPGYVNEQRYFGWVIIVFLFLLLNHLVLHLSLLQNHAFFLLSILDDEFVCKKGVEY